MTAKITKATKIPRQPPSAMMPDPSSGAREGTMVKISMTKDTMRAISRPE